MQFTAVPTITIFGLAHLLVGITNIWRKHGSVTKQKPILIISGDSIWRTSFRTTAVHAVLSTPKQEIKKIENNDVSEGNVQQ